MVLLDVSIVNVVALVGFVLVEGRFAKAPLVPLHVFRIGQLRAANPLVALIYSAFFPMWFFLALYLQSVLHFSPVVTGLLFLPLGLAVFVMSVLAPRLVGRLGHRAVITAGMLTAAGQTHGTGSGAITDGFSVALAISASVCLVGAIVALTTLPRRRGS